MFTISEHEWAIQGIMEQLTSQGETQNVLAIYREEVAHLLSAKSHHWAAIAAREEKDSYLFLECWGLAAGCEDFTDDIKANFYRDYALLLDSIGKKAYLVDEQLLDMRRYRTEGSVEALVDELAVAKIKISRGEYSEAWQELQKTMSDFYDRDSEQIMAHAQLHRDLVWWRMLAAGLSGNARSARLLGRNIFSGWSLVAKEVKLRRRVIGGIVMICPSFVQRRLIEHLLSRA